MTDINAKAKQMLDNMTVEQKIGHLAIYRGVANKATKAEEEEYYFDKLKRGCIGAIQASTDPKWDYAVFMVRDMAPNPILVCADMESGFPGSKRKLPPQLAITAASMDDLELAYEFGRITAIEAKKAGFNLVWGPSVDTIGALQREMTQRKLCADPYLVGKIATQIAKGYADEGMFFTAKHCPGGNDAILDSHLYAANPSYKTEQELLEWDLIPYMEMMKNMYLPGIMTNHKYFPNIDPDFPPTLSKKIVSFIRESLGFDGLLMTDSLAMMGIINKYGEATCIGQSIQAGHDMIITNYRMPYSETIKHLENAYNSGVITPERLDDAVLKVLKAQLIATKPATQDKITEKELIVLDRLNSDSICAITDEGVTASIDKDKKHLFIILTENIYKFEGEDEPRETSPLTSWVPNDIQAQLEEDFPGSLCMQVPEFPGIQHMHDISYQSTKYDDIVFLTFCKGIPYGMHDRLTLRITRLMDAVQNRIAAILHIGNPYALEDVPHVPRLIVGFSGGECEKYALEVLSGKREAKGAMPLNLKLK